jgi:hypothetical protein
VVPLIIKGRFVPALIPNRRKPPAASVVAVWASRETVTPSKGRSSVDRTLPDRVVWPMDNTVRVAGAERVSGAPFTNALEVIVKL